jgi:hypothetical protein
MRAFPVLFLVAAGVVLSAGALAQDRKGADTPHTSNPEATTGAAPSEPATQAPTGHRQPRSDAAPGGKIDFPPVSPYDQEIDRNLNICRNC